MENKIFWSYLGGIIDGEGYIASPYIRPSGSLIIVNTDKKLLEQIQKFLKRNGIKPSFIKRKTKQKTHHSEAFQLQIGGWKNLKIIFDNCPILTEKKYNRLKSVVKRGEKKEKLKQGRINAFIKLKKEHPEYSLRKVARILDVNLSNILYKWGVKELLEEKSLKINTTK